MIRSVYEEGLRVKKLRRSTDDETEVGSRKDEEDHVVVVRI